MKEYLQSKEKEVVSIMMTLFDEQQIMKASLASERREGKAEGKAESAISMLQGGKLAIEDIAEYSGLSLEEIKKLRAELEENKYEVANKSTVSSLSEFDLGKLQRELEANLSGQRK